MNGSIDWRWVGIGTVIMFGLTFVAGLLVAGVLGGWLGERAQGRGRVGAGW